MFKPLFIVELTEPIDPDTLNMKTCRRVVRDVNNFAQSQKVYLYYYPEPGVDGRFFWSWVRHFQRYIVSEYADVPVLSYEEALAVMQEE